MTRWRHRQLSITASTRSGSRAPAGKAWCAPRLTARAPRASSREVTQTRIPACRPSAISAVATPPPAPWISTVSPGLAPDWLKSIRYAVSQAVGRQAASAKLSSGGLSTRLAGGTHTCVAKVPG